MSPLLMVQLIYKLNIITEKIHNLLLNDLVTNVTQEIISVNIL
jgi:hypothetical protein